MKSRFLLIGLGTSQRSELERGHAGEEGKKSRSEKSRSEKSGQKKAVRKGGQKTVDRLVEILRSHPQLNQEGLVRALGLSSRSTVQKHLANLKKSGRIRRVGPDKGGHWEVRSEKVWNFSTSPRSLPSQNREKDIDKSISLLD